MSKTKKKPTAGDILRRIIMLAALVVFCCSAYQLFMIYSEYKEGTDEYSALEEFAGGDQDPEEAEAQHKDPAGRTGDPLMENPIDFAGLKAINQDVTAWLKVKALDISYPVTKGEDNDFYLHNTFEKEPNIAGCIFMEYLNKRDFSDKNTIIYGHNMKNGSMFGTLKKFREDGIFDKSPYIWIYTPEKIYKYEIFSCQEVGASSDTYQLSFSDDQSFQDYIKTSMERSEVESSVTVNKDDTIITLSTCTGNDTTRFVVQAKRIKTFQSK